MKKIRKVLVSFNGFFATMVSKVCAIALDEASLYGPPEAFQMQDLYGPPQPSAEEIAFQNKINMGKIIAPIILVLIGIGVILNKKLSKKAKAIIISLLAIIGVAMHFLLNYIKDMGIGL